jgi:hypothetical protein
VIQASACHGHEWHEFHESLFVEFVPFVAIFISQNLAEKARELAIAITEMFFRFLRALFPVAYF